MRGGFLTRVLTYVATIVAFRFRGKSLKTAFATVKFGGRVHPLVTRGLLEDVRTGMATVAAVLAAITASVLTLGFDLVRPSIWALGIGAFVAGLLQPKRPWRWWMISVLAIPLSYVLAENVGISADTGIWKARQALQPTLVPLATVYAAAILRFIGRKISGGDAPPLAQVLASQPMLRRATPIAAPPETAGTVDDNATTASLGAAGGDDRARRN